MCSCPSFHEEKEALLGLLLRLFPSLSGLPDLTQLGQPASAPELHSPSSGWARRPVRMTRSALPLGSMTGKGEELGCDDPRALAVDIAAGAAESLKLNSPISHLCPSTRKTAATPSRGHSDHSGLV